MFAQRELTRLRDLKAVHRYRISLRRFVCAAQAERVMRPLRWVDRVSATWRQLGPLGRAAAGPAGLWLLGSLFRRRKLAGPLMRWGPTIWNVVQGFRRGRPVA